MTHSPALSPVFDGVRAVLLDFDGPVTVLMPPPLNREVADAARAPLAEAGSELPEFVATTSDHLAVLRWAGEHSPALLSHVERACVSGEVDAARSSTLTAGTRGLLAACAAAAVPVVVVSNNAASAIAAFLERHDLARFVASVHGRVPERPELLKPATYLVESALAAAGCSASEAVLIGDSVSDVEVARATGVRSVGFAKHERRGRELGAAGADVIVESMSELTVPLEV